MAVKEEMKPIYAEVQACLSQAPTTESDIISGTAVWQYYNAIVDRLEKKCGSNLDRFRVEVESEEYDDEFTVEHVRVLEYRTKLAALVKYLHTQYFADEPDPLGTNRGIVISQSQYQGQSIHIQVVVDITEQLTRSEKQFKEGSKERRFIDKAKGLLKSAVSGVTNVAQLMLLILNLGKECGLSIDDLRKIFGG